ncbi:hypothetical protein O9992_26170 [Vibrio lentus]|nr:hypothetical protein [Vibrio lentus]
MALMLLTALVGMPAVPNLGFALQQNSVWNTGIGLMRGGSAAALTI